VRALLVVNPNATTTTAAGRDVLAHALASELKLEVLVTRYRGHAAEATAQAVRDGVELLVAHGGDGTVDATLRLADAVIGAVTVRLRRLDAPCKPEFAPPPPIRRVQQGLGKCRGDQKALRINALGLFSCLAFCAEILDRPEFPLQRLMQGLEDRAR